MIPDDIQSPNTSDLISDISSRLLILVDESWTIQQDLEVARVFSKEMVTRDDSNLDVETAILIVDQHICNFSESYRQLKTDIEEIHKLAVQLKK